MHEFKKCTSGRAHIGCQIFANISFMIAGVVQYRKEIQTFFSEGWRGRLRKVLAASSFCHHSVANASHRYEVQRSQRGPRAEHQTFSSRSRSIKTISRFFAIPQVASFAALAIRLSKFILQTHVLVSLAPRYYEQWGTTQPERNYTARRTALSDMLSSFPFPSLQNI